MYEIRVYRQIKGGKFRTAKIKKPGDWFGFFARLRLWFTLRTIKKAREKSYNAIRQDSAPGIY